jgi:hypothetical protein
MQDVALSRPSNFRIRSTFASSSISATPAGDWAARAYDLGVRIVLLIAVASCAPILGDSCPSGQEPCGFLDDLCFDPTTTTCCADFGGNPEICTAIETCNDETITCETDAWFNVVCPLGTPASSGYRGSYTVPPPNEAVVGDLPTHEYELQFGEGCRALEPGAQSGGALVTFDGTTHMATWTASMTDAGPLTFSGDPTLGLTSIAVLSWDGTGFHGDVTDAHGTHTVAFTFAFGGPTP